MYIYVNKDLLMKKGKIAGQVIEYILPIVVKLDTVLVKIENLDKETKNHVHVQFYLSWAKNGMAKIILKATQEELE